jgi:putative ABC transport system permease protein
MVQQFLFNLTLAFRAIRNNRLRTILTVFIIGLGITALVGILTAIEVMKASVYTNFSSMGANSFRISSDIIKKSKRRGGAMNRMNEGKEISYTEAMAFKERFHFPCLVGVSVQCTSVSTVHFGSEKTNPNVRLTGVDENYLAISDTKLVDGGNFSMNDLQRGAAVCILGNSVAKKIFKNKWAKGINQIVSVGDLKLRVIGIADTKGSSMIMNADNSVLIPMNTARDVYGGNNSYMINVKASTVQLKLLAAEEAEGLFRVIRQLPLGTENNFSITQNDSIATTFLDVLKYIRWAAVLIGIITLLGSVIGLMNIMLVSVGERTREIGVTKALGARSSTIKQQFLTESVLISLMGGLMGIILGMLIGNLLTLIFHTGFIVPWLWIGLGFSLCAFVGIISGIYPAMKASKLDPIVALRYE